VGGGLLRFYGFKLTYGQVRIRIGVGIHEREEPGKEEAGTEAKIETTRKKMWLIVEVGMDSKKKGGTKGKKGK